MMTTVRKQNGESGSALIEFALVSTVFLTLLFGIIDAGRALYAYDFVSSAARQGTRYAMVRGTSCSTDLSGCEGSNPIGAREADVQAYVRSFAVGINTDPTILVISARCWVGGSSFNPLPCAPGQAVWVQVRYNFAFITPLVPQLSWWMSSRSQRTVSQ